MDQRIKSLIFPKEHGAWALTFEPLVLALLLGPSLPGGLLFLGATFAFFAHPSARALLSRSKEKSLALKIFLGTALPALFFLGEYLKLSAWPQHAPLLLALALMVSYLILELFSFERALATEILASVSMGLIALSIVLSAGWTWQVALGFLALVYSRSIGTTVYIFYRLRLLKKQSIYVWPGILLHVLDGFLLLYLMSRNIIPVLGFLAGIMLIVRAFWNLSPLMKKATVRQLGFAEVYFGLAFLVLTAAGYWLGW